MRLENKFIDEPPPKEQGREAVRVDDHRHTTSHHRLHLVRRDLDLRVRLVREFWRGGEGRGDF